MIFDCRFPIADLGMRLVRARSGQSRMRLIGNRPLFGGPRGSRTHYPSIKSRELILMSFRPKRIANFEFPIANFESHTEINSDHAPAETRTRITH